jgi:hypothetical protein
VKRQRHTHANTPIIFNDCSFFCLCVFSKAPLCRVLKPGGTVHLSAERTKKIPAGASRETHTRSPEMEQPSVNGTDPVELFYPKEASIFAAVCAVVLAVIGIAGLYRMFYFL